MDDLQINVPENEDFEVFAEAQALSDIAAAVNAAASAAASLQSVLNTAAQVDTDAEAASQAAADAAEARATILGYRGWTPDFALETRGTDVVMRVTGWSGGFGDEPSEVGYITASGLEATSDNAMALRGPKGDPLVIVGSVTSSAQLPAEGAGGEAYFVGTAKNLYVWQPDTEEWLNVGSLKGDKGDKGDQGIQGVQGIQGIQGIAGPPSVQDFPYTWSTNLTGTPLAGRARVSATQQNTSTNLQMSSTDASGAAIGALVAAFNSVDNPVKGRLRIVSVADRTKYLSFDVTASSAETGYYNVSIAHRGSSATSPFSNGESVLIGFTPAGNKGEGVPTGGTEGQVIRRTAGGASAWETPTKAMVGLSNVDNTSDANKPISTAVATALGNKLDNSGPTIEGGYFTLKAFNGGWGDGGTWFRAFWDGNAKALRTFVRQNDGTNAGDYSLLINGVPVLKAASPAMTGAPTAPTPAPDDDSDRLATTAFVQEKVVTLQGNFQNAEVSAQVALEMAAQAVSAQAAAAGHEAMASTYASTSMSARDAAAAARDAAQLHAAEAEGHKDAAEAAALSVGAGAEASAISYASIPDILAAPALPAFVKYISTRGWDTANGVEHLFAKVGAVPGHSRYFEKGGDIWERQTKHEIGVPVQAFGEIGTSNDTAAVQAAIDYVRDVKGQGLIIWPASSKGAPGDKFRMQGVNTYPRIYHQTAGPGACVLSVPGTYDNAWTVGKAILNLHDNGESEFRGGGIRGLYIQGPGTGVETTPGNGSGSTPHNYIIGLGSQQLEKDPVNLAYRLYQFLILECRISQCLIGIELYKNLYAVTIADNFVHNNMIGLYTDLQHPNVLNNDFRYNDIAWLPRIMIDGAVTQCRFSLGRQALTGTFPAWHPRAGENDGGIQRSVLSQLTLWQNQLEALELGAENMLIGSLLRGPGKGDFPAGLPNSTLVRLRQRKNLILANYFFGGHQAAAIQLDATNSAAQPQTMIALNRALINWGPFVEKTNNGQMADISLLFNKLHILQEAKQSGDANDPNRNLLDLTKGLILHIPAGAGLVNGLEIVGNHARIDGASVLALDPDYPTGDLVLPTPLINVLDTGGAYGIEHFTKDNRMRLVSGVKAKSYYYADSRRSTWKDNPITLDRAVAANEWTEKPQFGNVSVDFACEGNVGYRTAATITVTIAAGQTLSALTNHGVDAPLGAKDIIPLPANSASAGLGVYVDTVSSTQVRIGVNTAAPTGGATFNVQIMNPYRM